MRVVVCQVDKSRGTMVEDATETDATMAQDWELLTILKKLMACGCAQPAAPLHTFALGFGGFFCVEIHFDHLNVERRLSIRGEFCISNLPFCADHEIDKSTGDVFAQATSLFSRPARSDLIRF